MYEQHIAKSALEVPLPTLVPALPDLEEHEHDSQRRVQAGEHQSVDGLSPQAQAGVQRTCNVTISRGISACDI